MTNEKSNEPLQDISDVLGRLKYSYVNGESVNNDTPPVDSQGKGNDIYDDDLKNELRARFMTNGSSVTEANDELYKIDETFIEEHENNTCNTKNREEAYELHTAKEKSEITGEYEVTEDAEVTDESEITEEAEITDEPEATEAPKITDEPEITEEAEIIDEPEVAERSKVAEEIEFSEKAIVKQGGEAEDTSDDEVTYDEDDTDVYDEADDDDKEPLTEEEIEMLRALAYDDDDLMGDGDNRKRTYTKNDSAMYADRGSLYVVRSDDADNGLFYKNMKEQSDKNSVADESTNVEEDIDTGENDQNTSDTDKSQNEQFEKSDEEKYELSSADLSLLLQFGCDDEILEIASEKDIERMSVASSLDNIEEEIHSSDEYGMLNSEKEFDTPIGDSAKSADLRQTLEEKIFSVYDDDYRKKRGGSLLRLIISASTSLLLFFYDFLPLVGVQLPGIMDRKEYYQAYVLIGLQLLLLCMLPSVKKVWAGIRRLFSRNPDGYSMLAVVLLVTVVYDIGAMTAKAGTPPVFHFVVSLAIVAVTAAECAMLTFEMRNYNYFFSDVLSRASGNTMIGLNAEDQLKSDVGFTLERSAGKGSTAEKMYLGGLDPTQNVYIPRDVSSTSGYFVASKLKSRKSTAPIVLILPAVIVAIVVGILTPVLEANADFQRGMAASLVALLITLPLSVCITSWLPFCIFNEQNRKRGFSFVNEQGAEQYSDCNVFVFRDMHVFEKCSPKSVNLATYDGTSREVLIGCLRSFYNCIGGPLSQVFSTNDQKSSVYDNCRLRRVAKSGVEAVVGANYSLLVGDEQFMARYGISFPKVTFKKEGDEVFSICVSINGRSTARIIVKYVVKEMFEMFAKRLEEDNIYCAVETFDPMINTRLLLKLRGVEKPPISVVHLGIEEHISRSDKRKEEMLHESSEESIGVLAKKSRLNLAVAVTCAKSMCRLRKYVNLYCYSSAILGGVLAFFNVFFGWTESINEFLILLYWIGIFAGFAALTFTNLPKKDRFSMELYRNEERADNMADNILATSRSDVDDEN